MWAGKIILIFSDIKAWIYIIPQSILLLLYYFIIIIIISVTIYFLFFKKSEGFSGLLNLNPLPTLSQIPKDAKNVKVENSDKSGKIIQKINQIDPQRGANYGYQLAGLYQKKGDDEKMIATYLEFAAVSENNLQQVRSTAICGLICIKGNIIKIKDQ